MSQTQRLTYRRLILELSHGAADPETIRMAAEFARGLDLDLHGLFIEDESLLSLAELPFIREIRLPTHQWQPIDPVRMMTELQQAADAARQRLQQIVSALGVRSAFEVVRGDPYVCIAGVCFPTDIVVVTDTSSAASAALRRAVEASPASVLMLPRRPSQSRGAVVAVARDPADPGLEIAERMAEGPDQKLLILLPKDTAPGNRWTNKDKVELRLVTDFDAEEILKTLSSVPLRLVVVTRSAAASLATDEASRVVTERHVPVLML
jgi:hypothetical protein